MQSNPMFLITASRTVVPRPYSWKQVPTHLRVQYGVYGVQVDSGVSAQSNWSRYVLDLLVSDRINNRSITWMNWWWINPVVTRVQNTCTCICAQNCTSVTSRRQRDIGDSPKYCIFTFLQFKWSETRKKMKIFRMHSIPSRPDVCAYILVHGRVSDRVCTGDGGIIL